MNTVTPVSQQKDFTVFQQSKQLSDSMPRLKHLKSDKKEIHHITVVKVKECDKV